MKQLMLPKPDNSLAGAGSSKTLTRQTSFKTNENGANQAIIVDSLAKPETRVVSALRIIVMILLIATTVLVSVSVYLYASSQEANRFVADYEESAERVITSFLNVVERSLGAIGTLSTSITSYARHTGQSFPNVTMPDFAVHGANLRLLSATHVVHWMPLVTDATRTGWEAYALENRGQINEAFTQDAQLRSRQDACFGVTSDRRQLDHFESVLTDGSGYHTRIWSNGGLESRGDQPDGTGPFLPLWQRSPVDGTKEAVLNMDFSKTRALEGSLDVILRDRTAVMNPATRPIPAIKQQLEANLRISQYREDIANYIDGTSTFIAYPVFESFDVDSQVVGVLATNIYWKILFSDLLGPSMRGIIVIVENSFNQTFSFRIDGTESTYICEGDAHDAAFDSRIFSADVNTFLQQRAGPRTRSYTTVPLNEDVGKYRLSVYPSQATKVEFYTNRPVIYVLVVVFVFAFMSIVFLLYSFVVDRRHGIIMSTVTSNAQKAAAAERELNEFLSHEVRNPLSAAISACNFVSESVNEVEPLADQETRQCVRDDVEIISTSLHFINDFLRSTLDIHRASGMELTLELAPTDLLRDVLEPVSAMVYNRNANFEIEVVCPEDLIIMISSLRIKQVVLNLVRNASKFVEKGFIRMRGEVVDGCARIYVEDSGPGIPLEMRKAGMFSKYQASLDVLSQGTGIGLCLSKKLMIAMDGDLWLDESYNSGIAGCPGACFVVKTSASPLDLEANLPVELRSSSITSALHVGPTEEPASLPENISVLFVDDDVVLRKLFMRAIRKVEPEWNVQEAASGETAIKLCETQFFDLIFLDQYMASVDKQLLGTETARAMRSKGINSFICGLSANDLGPSFLSAGADHFILKPMPCGREELHDTLIILLEKGKRRQNSSESVGES